MKVVINDCFGGFGLSDEAYEWLIENKGWTVSDGDWDNKEADLIKNGHKDSWLGKYSTLNRDDDENKFRTDPDVVAVVEALGEKANDSLASLKIVEVPDDVEFTIEEYDGNEHIAEVHRTWG